jgi:hypothetical protein
MPSRKSGARWSVLLLASLSIASTCERVDVFSDSESFPLEQHSLLPPSEGVYLENDDGEISLYQGYFDEDVELRSSVGGEVQAKDAQPIAFKHSNHTQSIEEGGLGMSCEFCHSNARQSKHAGVPPTETCDGCHKWIDPAGRAGLEQLNEYLKADGAHYGEPIPWVRVHDTPDFVHFDHSRHIKSGVECTDCHADMTREDVAVRSPDMTMLMGWCLECHAEHPSVDANYGADAELRRAELKDCYTCHK